MFSLTCFTRKSRAFTLLELLIAILITSILLLSSVIAYQHVFSKNNIKVMTQALINTLAFARITAIETQSTIAFCPIGNNGACGLNWQKGQMVVNQKNQTVYRTSSFIPAGYQLTWKSTLGDTDALRWRANGFTRGQQGSFWICANNPRDFSAQVIILRTGRVRVVMGKSLVGCEG